MCDEAQDKALALPSAPWSSWVSYKSTSCEFYSSYTSLHSAFFLFFLSLSKLTRQFSIRKKSVVTCRVYRALTWPMGRWPRRRFTRAQDILCAQTSPTYSTGPWTKTSPQHITVSLMPLHSPFSAEAMRIKGKDVFFLKAVLTEILQLKTLKGLALHDILTELHLLIHRGKRVYTETQPCCRGWTKTRLRL